MQKDVVIYKQAAIDAIECVGYDFSESGLSNPELEELCEAIGEVKQDMIMRIRHLPSAQSERKKISEEKMKIVIENYFKDECDVNTSIKSAFEKGFRIGVKKGMEL